MCIFNIHAITFNKRERGAENEIENEPKLTKPIRTSKKRNETEQSERNQAKQSVNLKKKHNIYVGATLSVT